MKYAIFNEDGLPQAFYDHEIHGDAIPPQAIEISDDQWFELIDNSGRRKWLDGAVVPYEGQAPLIVKSWTPLQFMEKFTYEERVALRTLAKDDPMAEDWLDLLRASQEVRMDDQRTMAGLNYMVLRGVLTYQRVAEITSA